MNIVLFSPEIPHNTGAIGRTCYVTNTTLHLIKPLGFDIDEKSVKRAGMDYWEHSDIRVYENFDEFLEKNQNIKIYMATTKAKHVYTEVNYNANDYIMFGPESSGIPEEILLKYPDTSIRIPMREGVRSINLSVSVGIILYEALRQSNFGGLELQGQLHRHSW